MKKIAIGFGAGAAAGVAGAVLTNTGINLLTGALTGVCRFFSVFDEIATRSSMEAARHQPTYFSMN